MYQSKNICYGITENIGFTLLYKTPIYYIDIFEDKIVKDVELVEDFNFNLLLIENKMEASLKSVYTKEDLKRIMDRLLQKQTEEIGE